MDSKIQLKNCYKIYKDPVSSVETVALKGINLSIYKGEFLSIIGPSGSGKSTLLNIIGGLDLPSAGQVIHFHENMIDLTTSNSLDRDMYRIKNIGYLQQKPILLPAYSALENVMLPLQTRGVNHAKSIAEGWLTKLGLPKKVWKSRPHQLSGGERQRVSLASALVFNPSIFLADEPTAEVDHETGSEILAILKDLNTNHEMTIILVTHDTELAKQSDRSLILSDGMIFAQTFQSESMILELKKDEFGRIELPQTAMEVLHQPNLLTITHTDDGIVLENAELAPKSTINPQSMIVVDKNNHILLDSPKKVILHLKQNQVIIKEETS
ncbi:MAG: ABC transporter ATP-binding protein [Candidatus Heimdallarchaeota archaeon]|nr:ABC transporter ATP-binding protein [Candidatus Heimdallarchaeota archaeon]